MKTWKAQKRLESVRGGRGWAHFSLSAFAWALLIVSAALAVMSCFPSSWQIPSAVWCMAFSIIGCGLALCLYILRDKFAARIMRLNLLCLALTVTVALVKVF
jgi:hypothetical protein